MQDIIQKESYHDLKKIFDLYYKQKPKAFIEILRMNAHLDDHLIEVLSNRQTNKLIRSEEKIKELEILWFLDNNENIILIGNPGTGKTALSIALGMKSCLSNKNVLFVNASNLFIELKKVMTFNQINIKQNLKNMI